MKKSNITIDDFVKLDIRVGLVVEAKPVPNSKKLIQLSVDLGADYGVVSILTGMLMYFPDPSVLGSDAWPAPSCLIWAGVSKAFAGGIGTLDPLARMAIAAGLALGVALVLMERFAPKSARGYVPSAAGLGIAMVVPGSNAIAMFAGALIALLVTRANADVGKRYVVPVASGLIAGESLMGVVIAMLIVAGVLAK